MNSLTFHNSFTIKTNENFTSIYISFFHIRLVFPLINDEFVVEFQVDDHVKFDFIFL